MCRSGGLESNAGKSKVMLLNGEEGLECEVHVDGIRLERVSVLKYFSCVWDESGKDGAVGRWRTGGAIRSLVNARYLQLDCTQFFMKHMMYLFLCI